MMYPPPSSTVSPVHLPDVKYAILAGSDRVVIIFKDRVNQLPDASAIEFHPGGACQRIVREGFKRIAFIGGPFELSQTYRISLGDGRIYPMLPTEWLDRIKTNKPLGLSWHEDGAIVRFFMPRAKGVTLVLYEKPGMEPLEECTMTADPEDGSWSCFSENIQPGRFYGFRVDSKVAEEDISGITFADPYAWAIAKRNTPSRESLSLVLPRDLYEQSAADHVIVHPRDLMVYETHMKDFSQLSGAIPRSNRGTYLGAMEYTKESPLFHVVHLGMNAIEWLPLQDYDYYEPPFEQSFNGVTNTWNRYSHNHWGYMPAYYFAPEARYAAGFSRKEGDWIGTDGRQVRQFRKLVNTCHDHGLAVIMDVVYNHVAQYGENPLRQIDPILTLRYDRDGKRIDQSHCGNDLRTENPMVRRLVVDSLRHFANFYGVDGFRFDLAGLLDGQTLNAITTELRSEVPGIHLIAEPWGGRYDKGRFSKRDWASWNDRFRDGVRGNHPVRSRGILFSQWGPRDADHSMIRHVSGHLTRDGGPFLDENHCVNYLTCHDGYTLADFIKVALEAISREKNDGDTPAEPLSIDPMDLHRLGMMFLMTGRGSIMVHQGDEWGWSKIIDDEGLGDPDKGMVDPNSYNKDNRTNWLDWKKIFKPAHQSLLEYSRGLALVRKKHPVLRIARREDIFPIQVRKPFAFGYRIKVSYDDLVVLLNASLAEEVVFPLPSGQWQVVADHLGVFDLEGKGAIHHRKAVLPPSAGWILKAVD